MFNTNSSVLGKCGYNASQLESVLKDGLSGLGQAFYNCEQTYNINALFIIAHAAIESAWGTSYIAKRNNLFGIAAYDSNPNAAYDFPSKEACIDYYGNFLKTNYLTVGGAYYEGTSIHDVFIHYSTSDTPRNEAAGIAEDESIAKLMNELLSTLPSQNMDNLNNTHVQVLSLNSGGTWDTLVDAMEADQYSDKTWNAFKALYTSKKAEIQRIINGVVAEDIKFDYTQLVDPTSSIQTIDQLNSKINEQQTTIDNLTKENSTLSQSLQTVTTEYNNDESLIVTLKDQITLLNKNMPTQATTPTVDTNVQNTVNTVISTGLNVDPVLKRWLKAHLATYIPTVITIIVTILSGHSSMTLVLSGFSFTIGNIIAVLLAIEKSFGQNL